MESNLLDRMLETYKTERKPVTVTLQNKVRVSGNVSAFDSYVLLLDGQRRELIYRHAISSLAPQDAQAEHVAQPVPTQKAPSEPRPKARPQEKPRQHQPRPEHAVKESGINTGMKEELLKWMQGQKAAK